MTRFIVVLLLAFFASPAAGGFEDGNRLLSNCEGDAVLQENCHGYLIAIADTMVENAINGFRACFPIGVSKSQIFAVATTYLKDHPEIRDFGAAGVVAAALSKAFPCTESQ